MHPKMFIVIAAAALATGNLSASSTDAAFLLLPSTPGCGTLTRVSLKTTSDGPMTAGACSRKCADTCAKDPGLCTNLFVVSGSECFGFYNSDCTDDSRVYVTADSLTVQASTSLQTDFKIVSGVLGGLLALTHTWIGYVHVLPKCKHSATAAAVLL